MDKSTKEHLCEEAIADIDTQLLPNYNAAAKNMGIEPFDALSTAPRQTAVKASANSISRQCLTTAEEESLIGFINKLSIRGIPPTASIVRNLAEEMIGCRVGKNWTGVFVKRYQKRLKSLYLRTIDKN